MDFNIEIETTGVIRNRTLTTLPDRENNRKFIAHGDEPGLYQLTAYTYKFRFSDAVASYRAD